MRLLVEGALRQGWDPGVRGGTHRMTERDGRELALAGFVLTDRVVEPDRGEDPTAVVVRLYERRDGR
ncbi:hypothetical protein ACQP00_17575 [Dactylosporangium sp. CS-047395]|uniref:hypothetical protein n=1 Tax=Dactylosporangium sp. CS-047395 TaxID=3239936 RepID=UPI003D8EF9A8